MTRTYPRTLEPLYACSARPASGGEWSYLLWVGGRSWWAGATPTRDTRSTR